MSANSLCLQILVRFSDYVTTTAFKRTQFLAGGRTRALWRQDAARADARRGSHEGRTRALWRQGAGSADARRGHSGDRTRADAGLSYFLAVYCIMQTFKIVFVIDSAIPVIINKVT
jgi:hypothetical protein